MRAYVVNLNDRGDRWNSVLSQQNLLGLEIVRVEAVSKIQITESEEPFVAPGVSATWKSHQKAMRLFLDSDEEFGLIMEDDFLIKGNFNRHFAHIRKYEDFDFIQLGILKPSCTSGIALLTSNARDKFLKFLCKITSLKHLQPSLIQNRVLIHEQQGVPFFLVCSDVRAGGQAYLVSRNFATAAQKMNQPAFLSTDGVYMSIGGMRSFRMFRVRKSIVDQTDSPTSVEKRFSLH